MATQADTPELELEELSVGEAETQQCGHGTCHNCAKSFPASDLTGRWRKKVCKACRRTEHCLWRHVGSWTPLLTLSDSERQNFFSKSSGDSNWLTLETHLVESLSRERVTALKVSVGGKYLPPSVWLAQGFTQDQLDRCEDWEEDPTLGRTCRLQVKEVSQNSVLRTVRTEVVNRVKEVAKNKKGTCKTWDLQASSQTTKATNENKAEKKAEKELLKSNKKTLGLAAKVLTPVTNSWLQTELLLASTKPGDDEATLGLLKESHALLQSWKTACENVLARKENTGDAPLTLPFSKEDVDTRLKTAATASKTLKECRKSDQQVARRAKRAAAAADAGQSAPVEPAPKRRRAKSNPNQ